MYKAFVFSYGTRIRSNVCLGMDWRFFGYKERKKIERGQQKTAISMFLKEKSEFSEEKKNIPPKRFSQHLI